MQLKAECYGSQNSTTIDAPKRATNQASASQRSTSSRSMILTVDVGLAANSAGPMRYLNSRIQSCYCAPIIWVFSPQIPETKVAARCDASA